MLLLLEQAISKQPSLVLLMPCACSTMRSVADTMLSFHYSTTNYNPAFHLLMV